MSERTITFCIRGFDGEMHDVIAKLGRPPSSFGVKGAPVREGRPVRLTNSFVRYEKAIHPDELWDDVIVDFLNFLGGVDQLRIAIRSINPKFVEIDLTTPVRSSDLQEDRYISNAVLRSVVELGADLSFGFV